MHIFVDISPIVVFKTNALHANILMMMTMMPVVANFAHQNEILMALKPLLVAHESGP